MAKGKMNYTACDPTRFKEVLKEKLDMTPAQFSERMGYSRSWAHYTTGRIPTAAAIWLKDMHGIDPSEYAPTGKERLADNLRENTAVFKMVVNGALDEKLFGDNYRGLLRGAMKAALLEYFGTAEFRDLLKETVKEALNE